uniref:Uncharacterized protein n=1 Tax=Amphiprion percula TaxID=161767 RepID=A0A3P8U7A0_AMPPE
MRVRSLRLPVQLLHEHQLRIFNPVGPAEHVDRKVAVDRDLVALDVVHSNVLIHGKVQRDPRTHRCVLGDLQTRLFPGELGGVVVDVLDLHLDVDEFELLFGEADHIESDEAVQGVFADPLPVYPLPDGQLPVMSSAQREGISLIRAAPTCASAWPRLQEQVNTTRTHTQNGPRTHSLTHTAFREPVTNGIWL